MRAGGGGEGRLDGFLFKAFKDDHLRENTIRSAAKLHQPDTKCYQVPGTQVQVRILSPIQTQSTNYYYFTNLPPAPATPQWRRVALFFKERRNSSYVKSTAHREMSITTSQITHDTAHTPHRVTQVVCTSNISTAQSNRCCVYCIVQQALTP